MFSCCWFNYELIKRVTANSNAYGNQHKKENFGIILKMSIDNRKLGGINDYFLPPLELDYGLGRRVKVKGFFSWASDFMPAYRFCQIRAALYPEMGSSTVGDHFHQLRASIFSLNTYAKCAFILGRHCSFDESRIASKSRNNPVHQYNPSKPDKYKIDFFVLVNASDGKKFIYHLDFYQGKNESNIHILEEAWRLPNALLYSGIHNDLEGIQEIYVDD